MEQVEIAQAVGFTMAKVDDEIICSRGYEPMFTVNEDTCVVANKYKLTSVD